MNANHPSIETSTGPTGPRTEEGKAISSRNAVTHGLTATKPENAVDPQVKAQYEALRIQYLDEFQPQGAIENTLMDMIVLAAWQLYKIKQMETFAAIDLGLAGRAGRSERLARYRASNERLLFRSLAQLRQIQQERALLAAAKSLALPARVAPGVRFQPLRAHLDWLAKPRAMSAAANQPTAAATPKPDPRAIILRPGPAAA
jgi:hypothetical protein